ncbi:ankyrin repeat-containing domain protein [Xylaria venustula]|nr:ankyrin repeat-containing domain protein [Xylaria venustula]
MDIKQLQQDDNRERALRYKIALGQRLSSTETSELEQIAGRKEAILNEKRRLLDAPHAHLPPLPPALPDCWDIQKEAPEPSQKEFLTWCLEGRQDAVEKHIEGQEDRVSELLLKRGLASACEGGKAQVARYLLQKGVLLHGLAVEYACRRNDLELFNLFIEFGWHPNQQIPFANGSFGVALLHCTSDVRVVRLLLAHGADPNLGLFEIWKRSGLGPCPPMNRRSGDALTKAAGNGNIEVIDLLLQHGAVLEWSTPLHYALSSWPQNRPAFIHVLRLGADPNRNIHVSYGTAWDGGTPLLRAIRFRLWDAVELLLEWGADPEASNIYACVSKMDHSSNGNKGKSLTEIFVALVDKVKQTKSNTRS